MHTPLQILLADDDSDDRFFFEKAVQASPTSANLTTAINGEKLMHHLVNSTENLPAVLFLDLNMPRKNGTECLKEIKQNEKLRTLPVIIYSTSLHPEIADELYEEGAHFYIKKTDLGEMQKVLNYVLNLICENKFSRPERARFILSSHAFNTA